MLVLVVALLQSCDQELRCDQVRRLMEEDNKKERKSMKRSHNDAVRELVAFVRKRDKRLAAHQAEEAKRRMEKEEQDRLR